MPTSMQSNTGDIELDDSGDKKYNFTLSEPVSPGGISERTDEDNAHKDQLGSQLYRDELATLRAENLALQTQMKVMTNRLHYIQNSVTRKQSDNMNEEGEGQTYHVRFHFIPDFFRTYFWFFFILMSLAEAVLTFHFGDFDPEDNLVYNHFGFNSYCVIFDEPPATYFGPALWAICSLFGFTYTMLCWIRLKVIKLDQKSKPLVSDCAYFWYTLLTVIEMLNYCTFATIFAIQDNIQIHTIPFTGLVYTFVFTSWKNLWYMRNVAGLKDHWKGKVMIVYVVVYTICGLIMATCTFIYTVWGHPCNIGSAPDKIWTLMTLGQILTVFNGDDLGIIRADICIGGLKSLGSELGTKRENWGPSLFQNSFLMETTNGTEDEKQYLKESHEDKETVYSMMVDHSDEYE